MVLFETTRFGLEPVRSLVRLVDFVVGRLFLSIERIAMRQVTTSEFATSPADEWKDGSDER